MHTYTHAPSASARSRVSPDLASYRLSPPPPPPGVANIYADMPTLFAMTHVAMTCSGPGLRYHMANDDGAGFITTCVDVGALNLTKVRAHKCAVLCCAVLWLCTMWS